MSFFLHFPFLFLILQLKMKAGTIQCLLSFYKFCLKRSSVFPVWTGIFSDQNLAALTRMEGPMVVLRYRDFT